MKQIKLTKLIDSVIDCLTEPDGGHAVGNGDVKDAVLELKEIKALFINGVILQSEQLQAVEDLKDLCYDTCPLDRRDDLSEIVDRL